MKGKLHVMRWDISAKPIKSGKRVYNCGRCPNSVEAKSKKEAMALLHWLYPECPNVFKLRKRVSE